MASAIKSRKQPHAKLEWNPARSTRAALRRGLEKKNAPSQPQPNLISLALTWRELPDGADPARCCLARTSLEPMHRGEQALRLLVRGQVRKELGDPA